jgi:hypothetical protein
VWVVQTLGKINATICLEKSVTHSPTPKASLLADELSKPIKLYRVFTYLLFKGLSHEIFGPVFGAVWIYLGLNGNRLWFLNFNDALLILDTYFKF